MDIQKLRNDTPGTNNVIHLNNAGASLMPKPVTEKMINYLREESLYGGYETASANRKVLDQTYSSIARFINAEQDEIALLENATTAWNMAFFAINFKEGDRILTSKSEYASNFISYLKLKKQVGVTIDVIPNDDYGQTSVAALQEKMDADVKLISITHIPTNSGLVNPVEDIGQIADQYPCFYLVDACQSVGHYPVDVQRIKCDMLSATGRKYLRGPRGTGFLYVKNKKIDRLIPPFLDLHSAEWTAENEYQLRNDARRFENWEMNYAGIMGLKTAVEYAQDIGIKVIWERVSHLAETVRSELSKIPAVSLHDIGYAKGGIISFSVQSIPANEIKAQLADLNINVSVSTKSSTLLDMSERGLDSLVRASVHYYNTEKEIQKFVKAIRNIS